MVIVIAAIFISVLILVISHEFGHFLAAKKFGIKVLEFGFGLPPRLIGKKIGGTIFSFNLLPIGGFVRLLGEDEVDPKARKDPNSFANKPVNQRMGVVVAGVLMNLLLSWILFYIVLFQQDFRIIYPTLEPVVMVAEVEPNSPADQAGIKSGERILAVDDKSVKNVEGVVSAIRNSDTRPVTITISDLEAKNPRNVIVTPVEMGPDRVPRIGVVFPPIPFKEYVTFEEKLFSGPSYSWDLTKLTFAGFGQLFSALGRQDYGTASESVAGPVGIAVIVSDIVKSGAIQLFLWFLGVMSLTLAIINILPFPALDGGRLVFLAIEAVFGRAVKPVVEKWIHLIGMALLLGLIALITYSDIQKFILR